jgi:hypothetical protein
MQDRQAKRERAYDNLEKDLVIQGGSAIEDKLQDDVAHTIDVLRAARIKFWMLTGDKYSTALQIATACNLKSPGNHRSPHNASSSSSSSCAQRLSDSFVCVSGSVVPLAEDRSILCSIEGSTKDAVGECIRVYLKELKSHGVTKGSISSDNRSSSSADRRSNSNASQAAREAEQAQLQDFKEYGPYYDTISEDDDHFKTVHPPPPLLGFALSPIPVCATVLLIDCVVCCVV